MNASPITGLTFIRLFYYIFRLTAIELGLQDFYDSMIVLTDLEQKMEILACDANCASIRPSELALVAICTQMDASISKLETGSHQIHGLVDYAIQLQKLCRVSLICLLILFKINDLITLFNLFYFNLLKIRFPIHHSFTRMSLLWEFCQATMVSKRWSIASGWYGS